MSELVIEIELARSEFSLSVRERISASGITAVFGPSGSGKTTLLRVIAGLEPGARGRIEFDGTSWQSAGGSVPAHHRRIGYVFQEGRLFPHLDVSGNLRFGTRHARGATKIALTDVVNALDLDPLLGRRIDSLSGGERQRVAIGRALLSCPDLLLMDEPLSSLDSARRGEILSYIEALPARFGLPIIYVTHSIAEVTRLAEHMLLVADGRVVERGPTRALLERMDLWELTGRREAGAALRMQVQSHSRGMTTLMLDGQALRVPAISATPGTELTLKINARDVAIATQRPENLSIRNVLAAQVAKIDYAGEIYAELLLTVGSQRLRARITREAVQALGLDEGQDVFALIKSVLFEDYAQV